MCAFRAVFARDSGFRRNDEKTGMTEKKREWRIFAVPVGSFFGRFWMFGVFTRPVPPQSMQRQAIRALL